MATHERKPLVYEIYGELKLTLGRKERNSLTGSVIQLMDDKLDDSIPNPTEGVYIAIAQRLHA